MQDNEPKTGADLKAHHEATAKYINALADKMRLKQWAVEQAVNAGGDVQENAKFFFNFVTKVDV